MFKHNSIKLLFLYIVQRLKTIDFNRLIFYDLICNTLQIDCNMVCNLMVIIFWIFINLFELINLYDL
jgi:hypothetical protein